MRNHIKFYINSKEYEVTGADVSMNLSEFLRNKINLKGTKVVCAEGDCGACTVMIKKLGSSKGYYSINSCIKTLALLDGYHIVTIEGMKVKGATHEIQEAMVRNNGAQCGHCTPGFIMSLAGLFEKKTNITEKNCRNYLTGNLCRCTGYGPILDAASSVDSKKCQKLSELYPNEMTFNESAFSIVTKDFEVYAPDKLKDALRLKQEFTDIKLVSSATDLGVQYNKGVKVPKRLMTLDKIKELSVIEISNDEITIGARSTLTDIETALEGVEDEFSEFLKVFASPQIKNTATIVGNIANASPIGDSLPYLIVMNSRLVIEGPSVARELNINDFYLGYKKIDLRDNEIITKVIIPRRIKGEVLKIYKVSRRKDLDISSVNAAIFLKLKNKKIAEIKIAFGGVGPTVLRLSKLESKLKGESFDADSFRAASHMIKDEITPMSDVRGTAEYRQLVAKNLFQRFFLDVSKDLSL